MENHSQKFLQRRRFLIVLPIIVLPFTAIVFWLMGGGTGVVAIAETKNGLNLQLPDAKLPNESALDKLKYYAMADRDSIKRSEQLRMDPNVKEEEAPINKSSGITRKKSSSRLEGNDEDEDVLNQKLAQLQRQLQPERRRATKTENADVLEEATTFPAMAPAAIKQADPDIAALNGALDKILEIQHPERVKENKPVTSKDVFTVSSDPVQNDNSFFGVRDTAIKNGFHSVNNDKAIKETQASIWAVVHGTQIFQSGSVVKLRLLNGIYVNGSTILEGTFVYGTAFIEDERLRIGIFSIQSGGRLYPVSLTVYDLDGIAGIYIPGSLSRDVVKQTTEQAIQSVTPISLDPSITSQATAAGIGAAKSLLTKKVKVIRVTVKSGHKVLLKNDKETNR